MIDEADILLETATRAVNRRKRTHWLLTAFTVLAVVNALALIGLVVIGHDQQATKRHSREQDAHIDSRLDDIYRGLNTVSAQLGKLVTPPPAPIVLKIPTTTTTIRPSTTAVRPSQPPSPSTPTTGVKPSTTTTTAPRSTSTTVKSCPTVPLVTVTTPC